MPDWQWRRVQELASHEAGRIQDMSAARESGDPEKYQKIVQQILSIPPRYWQGWSVQADLLLWHLYRDMLPEPVHDHINAYWEGWLMPDVPTEEFLHPQSQKNSERYQRTGDWRGRKSFFRDGYNYTISTMNFKMCSRLRDVDAKTNEIPNSVETIDGKTEDLQKMLT